MNKLFTIISAVFILMSSCAIGQNQNDISIEELKNKIASQKYILVDVRTSEEYNNGHLKGSINIDYFSDDFSDEISSLGLESPILVYCRSGNRSGKAMKIMYDLGFIEVKNFIGGYKSWISEENLIIKE
jgi:rhodanese-related sulfurtransferase